MGKTALSNLRVTAEGSNIEFSQSPATFVGNFEAGKNEYYDLSIIPVQAGPVEGNVVFTFENAAGEETRIERPFSFTAQEMPAVEVPDGGEMPAEGAGSPYTKYIIGAAVVAAIAAFVIFKKRRKKKMDDSLDIEI